MSTKYAPTTKEYHIFVRDKLYRVCKTEPEMRRVRAKLLQDKNLTDDDIRVVFKISVEKIT